MALLTGPLAVCSVCCSTNKISEDGNYRVDTQRTRQRRRLKFDSSRVVGLLGLQLLGISWVGGGVSGTMHVFSGSRSTCLDPTSKPCGNSMLGTVFLKFYQEDWQVSAAKILWELLIK